MLNRTKIYRRVTQNVIGSIEKDQSPCSYSAKLQFTLRNSATPFNTIEQSTTFTKSYF